MAAKFPVVSITGDFVQEGTLYRDIYEVKSAKTFQAKYTEGLDYFSRISGGILPKNTWFMEDPKLGL